MNIVRLADDIW